MKDMNKKFEEYNSAKNEIELQIEIQRKRAEVLNMIMSILYSKNDEKTGYGHVKN